jgi:hypothetical protein
MFKFFHRHTGGHVEVEFVDFLELLAFLNLPRWILTLWLAIRLISGPRFEAFKTGAEDLKLREQGARINV